MVRLVTATRETTCIYFLGKTCVDSDLFIFHYYYYLLTKKKIMQDWAGYSFVGSPTCIRWHVTSCC